MIAMVRIDDWGFSSSSVDLLGVPQPHFGQDWPQIHPLRALGHPLRRELSPPGFSFRDTPELSSFRNQMLMFRQSLIIETFVRDFRDWAGAKLLAGVGVGAIQMTLPVYITEWSPVNIRGAMIVVSNRHGPGIWSGVCRLTV